MTGKRRSTGPDSLTVEVVIHRDRGRCARCGERPAGDRGWGWSVHHRQPRQMGGTRQPWSNSPANLILLCGSGVDLCHGWVEKHRAAGYDLGLLVRRNEAPWEARIRHAVHGLCWLTDDGEAVYEVPVMSA